MTMTIAEPATTSPQASTALARLLAPVPAENGFAGHAVALSLLVTWLAEGGRESGRNRLLLTYLRGHPDAAAVLSKRLLAFLTGGDLSRLFCDAGLPPRSALVEEFSTRIMHRLLPAPISDRDPSVLISRLSGQGNTARWIDALHPLWVAELLATLPDGAELWRSVHKEIADGMEVIALRITARSEEPEMRYRSGAADLHESPFQQLMLAVRDLAVEVHSQKVSSTSITLVQQRVAVCRVALKEVHDYLERNGVRVDVVFWLNRIRQQLARILQLLPLIEPDCAPEEIRKRGIDYLRSISVDERRKLLVGALLKDNYATLSGRIVENSRHTGGHYITDTAKEWRGMLLSASGGGIVTGFAVLFKAFLHYLHLPLLLDWAMQSANYSGSFLFMQLCGFSLATKQPPMTAAALAEALEDDRHLHDITAFAELCSRIVRSQLAAVVGNLALVIIVALGIDAVWNHLHHAHIYDPQQALEQIHSFHPFRSGSIFFAIITGVALWLSSIIAGYGDNFAHYHRIPQAVQQSPVLVRWLGWDRTRRLGAGLTHQVGQICNNFFLGVMLSTIATLGVLTGTGLAVRHITFATGTFTFACCSLGMHDHHREMIWAVIGIAIIGVLNFGVGFALSLMMAMRARDVPLRDGRRMFGRLFGYFLRNPVSFVLPRS